MAEVKINAAGPRGVAMMLDAYAKAAAGEDNVEVAVGFAVHPDHPEAVTVVVSIGQTAVAISPRMALSLACALQQAPDGWPSWAALGELIEEAMQSMDKMPSRTVH